jgi:hypothetical protein
VLQTPSPGTTSLAVSGTTSEDSTSDKDTPVRQETPPGPRSRAGRPMKKPDRYSPSNYR